MEGERLSCEEPFDLIVVDAPCSNSGVLARRAEARWRISEDSMREQCRLQGQLIAHARTLLAPGGEILFMTCSILKGEHGVHGGDLCQTILPNNEGWDGGYGCLMR